ncbi:MAG: hypothetical protein IJA23_00795 [Clostridia bacterium]|nr:hypothetical protein [Clostridia bacterium]
MEFYDLDEDEVVLYKGCVALKDQKGITELILTNKNFVFITKIKKLFAKDEVVVDEFPTNEVKIYNGEYQVLKKGNIVEIYFLHDEIEFAFEIGNECRKFMNSVLKLLTSKNKFERVVDKTKEAIHCVDNSLGVDSVGIVKSVATNKTVVGKIGGAIKHIGFGKKKEK